MNEQDKRTDIQHSPALQRAAEAFEASIDAVRKARGKPTREEIYRLGVGTPEWHEANDDFLRDMLIAMGEDPDAPDPELDRTLGI